MPTSRTRSATRACATSSSMRNGNRLLDGPQELGLFRSTQGGAGFVDVDDNLRRPYSQEISTHLEREIMAGLSGRVSYVYKNVRDEYVEIDPTRAAAMTIPIHGSSTSASTASPTPATTRLLNLLDRAGGARRRRALHQPDRPDIRQRLPDRGVRGQPPLRRSLDAPDVVRLHLARPVPCRDDRYGRARRAGTGARTTGGRTSGSSATRARKPRRCGTTRSSAATSCRGRSASPARGRCRAAASGAAASASLPGRRRRRACASRGHGQPRADRQHPRLPRRQDFCFGRFGKVTGMLDVFNAEQRHGHRTSRR